VNKGTILIVQSDQDQDLTSALQSYLAQAGYRVLFIADQEAALMLARTEFPQSVILDLDTPELDAAALIQQMRATPRTSHIHITLLTPRGEREDKLTALAAGADEFLAKPVDVEELGLRVRNALRRAMFDNLMNPVSGLPGPRLIEEQLRSLLRRAPGSEWAILRLSLNGFRPFGEVYGFLAGEEVLRFAAHLFGQIVDRLGTPDDFIGHSGGDNFVLITAPDRAAPLSAELCAHFNENVKMHYSFHEREQGYLVLKNADGNERQAPLMTLAVHTTTNADGPFSDIRELTQALS
jgi:PleD family two-component response regulator